jgi:hypothetical protein
MLGQNRVGSKKFALFAHLGDRPPRASATSAFLPGPVWPPHRSRLTDPWLSRGRDAHGETMRQLREVGARIFGCVRNDMDIEKGSESRKFPGRQPG